MKVIANLGLCVSVYDIRSIKGGFIFPGEGSATYTVPYITYIHPNSSVYSRCICTILFLFPVINFQSFLFFLGSKNLFALILDCFASHIKSARSHWTIQTCWAFFWCYCRWCLRWLCSVHLWERSLLQNWKNLMLMVYAVCGTDASSQYYCYYWVVSWRLNFQWDILYGPWCCLYTGSICWIFWWYLCASPSFSWSMPPYTWSNKKVIVLTWYVCNRVTYRTWYRSSTPVYSCFSFSVTTF